MGFNSAFKGLIILDCVQSHIHVCHAFHINILTSTFTLHRERTICKRHNIGDIRNVHSSAEPHVCQSLGVPHSAGFTLCQWAHLVTECEFSYVNFCRCLVTLINRFFLNQAIGHLRHKQEAVCMHGAWSSHSEIAISTSGLFSPVHLLRCRCTFVSDLILCDKFEGPFHLEYWVKSRVKYKRFFSHVRSSAINIRCVFCCAVRFFLSFSSKK